MFDRLIHLIEIHSRDLANHLVDRVHDSIVTPKYEHVPREELRQAVYEIYRHLGSWLCRSNAQVGPKTNGATASRKRCRRSAEPNRVVSRRDVVRCLSCLHRNGARAVLRGGGAGNSTSLPDEAR